MNEKQIFAHNKNDVRLNTILSYSCNKFADKNSNIQLF